MRAFVFLILLGLLPGMASAWWNEDWPYRVPVKLDTSPAGANVPATATSVPVLVRLHSANFEDFFLIQEDLSDLRFIAQDDKTPLKFHVESFDLLNQLAFIWVQVPQVSGGLNTEKVWVYYGNEQAVSAQDYNGTFDVNQVAAFHFSQTAGVPVDKTAYNNVAVIESELISPRSLIAGGLSFAGTGAVVLKDSPSLALQADRGFTVSAWIKPIGVQRNTVLISRSSETQSLELSIDQSSLYAKVNNGSSMVETPRTAPLTLDTWQHVALVVRQNAIAVYVNGAEMAAIDSPAFGLGGDIYVGALGDNSRAFIGELDELRVSNTARGAEALAIAAKSEGIGANLVAVGKGEQLGNAGGTNYFITIFQNTGTEGWVVIVLLTIMAVLSWIVMAFKTAFLGRVKKDNIKFLEQYNQLSNQNLAAIDRDGDEDHQNDSSALFGDHDHFQASPLYHVYHRGIAELKDRMAIQGGNERVLNEYSVNSIRSGLEAYVTREVQSLNRNMVLLTIAVSGGPFLGLLGTVLGVMITFAAIAASGDVNIAAIAPGVAAALLTTVFGLIVAIPALFGYNWLATRIKAMVADMHVFTEEFITKMAEQYSK